MFSIDYRSGLPIYEQLYRQVNKLALLGALLPHEKLPAVRQVAQQLGVNFNTVQKAYQMLEHDGVIYSVPGKGSFLAENTTENNKQRLQAEQRLQEAVQFALDSGVENDRILQLISTLLKGEDTHD